MFCGTDRPSYGLRCPVHASPAIVDQADVPDGSYFCGLSRYVVVCQGLFGTRRPALLLLTVCVVRLKVDVRAVKRGHMPAGSVLR